MPAPCISQFTDSMNCYTRNVPIALSPFELLLQPGSFEPVGMNSIHSCLRDVTPDAWGRRVFILQHNLYGVFYISPYNN